MRGGSVSREGVQRDLLPLIEGTTVATKYGPLKTDHILFIASGAFHIAKPADLLPELQGRLPIRVELKALTQDDFVRILSATRASLTEQYQALLGTEGVTIEFADDGIEALARIAAEVNEAVENIGARRLQTVMEKLLEDVSFDAEDRRGETLVVDCGVRRTAASEHRPQRRSQPLRALTSGSRANLSLQIEQLGVKRCTRSNSLVVRPPDRNNWRYQMHMKLNVFVAAARRRSSGGRPLPQDVDRAYPPRRPRKRRRAQIDAPGPYAHRPMQPGLQPPARR